MAYGKEFFIRGLERHGFTWSNDLSHRPAPGDVLLLWNRGARDHTLFARYKAAGARVIVAENGYTARTSDRSKLYALAFDHHNGAGTWPVGDGERWKAQGIELQPWREGGDHLLVLPQRGIGAPPAAMPQAWPSRTMAALAKKPRRVVLRRHPGGQKTEPYDALRGCYAAVTWGSGAAIKAIIAGYPVFHDMAQWIGAPAARFGIGALDDPWMGDRVPMLERLGCAQWTAAEIESGEAFEWLLRN